MSVVTTVLSAVFWGLLMLSLLVVVHEAGHFGMARAFGVRVTEFFLGLPCRWKLSWRSKRQGTEFGVTPFLLGGYNRICGMEYTDDELLAPAFGIVQREGRVSPEAVAAELGIDEERGLSLMNVLADLGSIRPYYDPELGEYPTQREYPARYETVARDGKNFTCYDREHDFALEGSTADGEPHPVEDAAAQLAFEKSRTYVGMGYLRRLAILVAGPVVNLTLAFVLVTAGYMSVSYEVPQNVNVLGSVGAGSLAEAAGLAAGDEVLAVGDTEVSDWLTLSDALSAAREAGEDFDVTYVRAGAEAVAHIDMPEGEEVELIGVSPAIENYHLSLAEAARAALDYAGMVGGVAIKLILPQHTMEVLDQSTSIVGISVMASEAFTTGFLDALALVAAVSMSLGFMNLLPIPPLDGGKILLETVELLMRRPLSVKARVAVSYVGVAFFAFVFVVVLRNDFMRFLM